MILVLAEKEALGKYIAEALPGTVKESKDGNLGHIIKGDYTIVWTNGHLLTLKDPEDIDKKYKAWSLDLLPMYFDPWGNKVARPNYLKKGQTNPKELRVKEIGSLLKQADSVIHAGDIDEEGQLLIDELLQWHKYKGPVKRLDTASTAKAALQSKLKQMTDNKSCVLNGASAYARSLADKTFGYNLGRYYSCMNDITLSVGRVQTPTLGLVVNRDLSIENHHKMMYYNLIVALLVDGVTVQCRYIPNPDDPDLTDGKYLSQEPLITIGNAIPDVLEPVCISKSIEKEKPPLPFNLNKLNLFCSKNFGYKPDKVMEITQSLRDDFNAITYNRSDCQYLGDEHYMEAPETIAVAASNLGMDASIFDTSIKSDCFNNANITAHFAIIPTTEQVDVSKLSTEQRNVYMAICYYYFAQFMPPATKEKTRLKVDLGYGDYLTASSTVIVDPGYRELLTNVKKKKEKDNSEGLETIAQGEYQGEVVGCELSQKETKPLQRYTQATLEDDMTKISKYVTNPEVKKILLEKDKGKKGECGSIGTSATRSKIIENLIERGFLAEQKKGKKEYVISTDKGRRFYQALPDNIKTAEVTARWWVIQEDIKNGKATKQTLLESVLDAVNEVIQSGQGKIEGLAEPQKDYGTCPECGRPLRKRKGKYGDFISCSGYPECKYIQSNKKPAKKVGVCPECGGDLLEHTGKRGMFVACGNYPKCKYILK